MDSVKMSAWISPEIPKTQLENPQNKIDKIRSSSNAAAMFEKIGKEWWSMSACHASPAPLQSMTHCFPDGGL